MFANNNKYIIGHYDPSVWNIDLISHIICTYISGGTYSLKSTPKDRFWRNFFMVGLFTLRVIARNLVKENDRRNTFCILFWCLAWSSNPGFMSNKPHNLLYCGDYMSWCLLIFLLNICLTGTSCSIQKTWSMQRSYWTTSLPLRRSYISCMPTHMMRFPKCLQYPSRCNTAPIVIVKSSYRRRKTSTSFLVD